MKRSSMLILPVFVLFANAGFCQPPKPAAPPSSEAKPNADEPQSPDPATPSRKVDDVLTAIRGVEELDKLQKDVDRLRAQAEQLSQSLVKQITDQTKLIESLRATITQQTADQNKLLTETKAALQKQLADQQRILDQQLSDEAVARAKLKADLETAITQQRNEQKQLLAELAARLNELDTRLSTLPAVKLQALITDETPAGAAILEIDGATRLVRGGDAFSLPPDAENNTVRSILVKEVTDSSVLLEVGPHRQPIVIR